MINELCEEWEIPKPEYELSEPETKVIFKSSGEAIVIREIEKLGVELNERQEGFDKESWQGKGELLRNRYIKL